MLIKTRGIVFRTVKFGETSIIADIFTEEKGLHAFVGSGVRAPKSRMPFNLFQPMTVLDMVTYYRDDEKAVNRLKEVRAGHVYTSIPFDLRKGAVALFMAEICRKSIHDTDGNRPLFDFLFETLAFLDSTKAPFSNVHLHFLLGLSGFLGFQPPADDAGSDTPVFDLEEGVFREKPPFHSNFIEPGETSQMVALLKTTLENCHLVKISRPERKSLLRHLLKFYHLHVPEFSEIHTPDILESVLE